MTKATKKKPRQGVSPSSRFPKIRTPYDRERVCITFPEQGQTKQSFKDECDVNKIVDTFARTGVVTNIKRGDARYGDAPESTLFEAACVQAELRSADEEGRFADEEPSDAPEASENSEGEPERREPENGSQTASESEQSAEGQ